MADGPMIVSVSGDAADLFREHFGIDSLAQANDAVASADALFADGVHPWAGDALHAPDRETFDSAAKEVQRRFEKGRYKDGDLAHKKAQIKPNNYNRPNPIGNTEGVIYPQTELGPPGGNTNPPVQPETEQEKGWWQRWGSTATHTVLDVAGLIPGVGTVTSLIDAGIYAAEGDMVSAGISAATAVPIAGNIGRAGKLAVKGGKAVAEQASKKVAQEVAEGALKGAAKQGAKQGEKKVAQKAATTGGGHVKPKSLREQYLGRTPGKNSRTGKEVQERMRKEGKLRDGPDGPEFKASDGEWYPLKDADMAHNKDAVTWWNETGRELGAKSKEVRDWMLDSSNYTLDHYGINRSAGAKLPDRYLPPLK